MVEGHFDSLSLESLIPGSVGSGVDIDDLVDRGVFLSPADELADISTHDSSARALVIATSEANLHLSN
jgi:hypothetical protein